MKSMRYFLFISFLGNSSKRDGN